MISKLEAARQHMSYINRYATNSNSSSNYPLQEMTEIYEDTLDFLSQLYALCDAWRLQRSVMYAFDGVYKLENQGKELEHLAHAMLYKIETLHKCMKSQSVENNEDDN